MKNALLFMMSAFLGASAAFAEDVPHPVVRKLNSIRIPRIVFDNVTIEDAVDFLRLRAAALDPEQDPAKKGISMIVRAPKQVCGGCLEPDIRKPKPINYRAKDIPFCEALKAVATLANLDAYITSIGIVLCPKGEPPFPNLKAKDGDILLNLSVNEKDDSKSSTATGR